MRPADDDMSPDGDVGRVVDLLSSMTADDAHRDELPAGLWDQIAGQLHGDDQPKVLAPRLTVVSTSEPTPDEDRFEQSPSTVTPIDAARPRRQPWLRVAAAAAAVVFVAAGTFGIISANDGTSQELVASVELEPLKAAGTGTAELITVDGRQQLRITAEGLPAAPEGHHYEMWLVDPDVTDPRSIGVLPPGQDEIVVDVPEGVDPDAYPIVDINVQVDGEEQHSGVETSVLRGVLA
jgi:hypothetical protein